jgi:ATP adenylyltransferase
MIHSTDGESPSSVSRRRFEWVMSGLGTGPVQPFDTDLYNFETSAVLPTVGSLVPGWVLMVPRFPALCFAAIPAETRSPLVDATNCVANDLVVFGGSVFAFEHGPRTTGSIVGCGVDQAHLHMASLPFDLADAALDSGADLVWHEVDPTDPWTSIRSDRDYYLVSNLSQAYVAYPQDKESQFFRKLVARGVGVPDQWDYRRYPNERYARETLRVLGNSLHKRSAA